MYDSRRKQHRIENEDLKIAAFSIPFPSAPIDTLARVKKHRQGDVRLGQFGIMMDVVCVSRRRSAMTERIRGFGGTTAKANAHQRANEQTTRYDILRRARSTTSVARCLFRRVNDARGEKRRRRRVTSDYTNATCRAARSTNERAATHTTR